MSIRIDNKPFQKALSTVNKAVAGKEGIETHALVQVRGEHASITCVSPAMSLTTRIPVRTEEDADFTIPARKCLEISKRHDDGDIWSINRAGLRLSIFVGKTRYAINSLDADTFNKPESIGKEHTTFIVDSAELAGAIADVLPSAGKNDARGELNSVNLTVANGSLLAVATDGHRLSCSQRNTPIGSRSPETTHILLPRQVAVELASLGVPEVTAHITIKGSSFQARVGEHILISKTLPGRYPDWQRVIPSRFASELIVNRERLIMMLRSASTLADEKRRCLRIAVQRGALIVESAQQGTEGASLSMDLESESHEAETGLSADYLLDALSPIAADSVRLQIGTLDTASMIQPAGDGASLRTLIMPMRI